MITTQAGAPPKTARTMEPGAPAEAGDAAALFARTLSAARPAAAHAEDLGECTVRVGVSDTSDEAASALPAADTQPATLPPVWLWPVPQGVASPPPERTTSSGDDAPLATIEAAFSEAVPGAGDARLVDVKTETGGTAEERGEAPGQRPTSPGRERAAVHETGPMEPNPAASQPSMPPAQAVMRGEPVAASVQETQRPGFSLSSVGHDAQGRVNRLTVAVNPEGLGPVMITLAHDGARVELVVTAEHPAVAEAIRRDPADILAVMRDVIPLGGDVTVRMAPAVETGGQSGFSGGEARQGQAFASTGDGRQAGRDALPDRDGPVTGLPVNPARGESTDATRAGVVL